MRSVLYEVHSAFLLSALYLFLYYLLGLLLRFLPDFGGEVAADGMHGEDKCREVVGKAEHGDEVGYEVGGQNEVSQSTDNHALLFEGYIR